MKRMTVALLLCAFSVATLAGCAEGDGAKKPAGATTPAAGAAPTPAPAGAPAEKK